MTVLHARRTTLVVALACSACQADDSFVVQHRGEIITYATTDDEIEVCEGNLIYAERWMKAVADQLGIAPNAILPTTYHLVPPDEVDRYCASSGGCANIVDDHIEIYTSQVTHGHELVHAIQFSAWPRQRALLREGLAEVYSDYGQVALFWNPISSDHFDELIELDSAAGLGSNEIYFVGAYIVYWVIARHGTAKLEEFWRTNAASGSLDATEFRATFEQHFGESLEDMIADAQLKGPAACIIPTCVDDLVEWQGDRWTFDSPQECGGTVRGKIDGDEVDLEQSVLVEITTPGPYVVSVVGVDPDVPGVTIAPCRVWCGGDDWLSVGAGESDVFDLQAGRYRVWTYKIAADDPGVTVEIRPAG
jgi:hypothetical protein